MPTVYSPVTDHRSLDYLNDLNSIHQWIDSHRFQIEQLLENYGVKLEYDDRDRFYDELKTELVKFALECNAIPLRTPRMLIATVSKIAQKPQEFLEKSDKFDPEATALVWDEVARRSPANRELVTNFELGIGSGPLPSEIALAARIVLERLEVQAGQQNRGRPHLVSQTTLACELGRIFRGQGGRITRITFDGETGPFHDFLNLVLPAVRTFAKTLVLTSTLPPWLRRRRSIGTLGLGSPMAFLLPN